MHESIEKAKSFFESPMHSDYFLPFRDWGDWLTLAGLIAFCISVFALDWMTVKVNPFGAEVYSKGEGLFISPWAWVTIVIIILVIAGFWFVQTRGLVAFCAGLLCIAFSIVFYIGAWMKIRAIIGDVIKIAYSIPFIGGVLGEITEAFIKNNMSIGMDAGYWLFIPAGLLITAGGFIRFRNSGGFRTTRKKTVQRKVSDDGK